MTTPSTVKPSKFQAWRYGLSTKARPHYGEVRPYLRISPANWSWLPEVGWSAYDTAHGRQWHPHWRWGWLVWGVSCTGEAPSALSAEATR